MVFCKTLVTVLLKVILNITSRLGQDGSSQTHLAFGRLQILFVHVLLHVLQYQVCLLLYDAD